MAKVSNRRPIMNPAIPTKTPKKKGPILNTPAPKKHHKTKLPGPIMNPVIPSGTTPSKPTKPIMNPVMPGPILNVFTPKGDK